MFHALRPERKRLFARILAAAAIGSIVAGWSAAVRAETELLMVEQAHCEWCEAWHAEIGGIYPLTEEGHRAPLRRQDLFGSWPADVVTEGRVHFTPTFILLVDGRETGRIEGYPGEHFFWPMLDQMLKRLPSGAEKPLKEGNGS